MQQQQNIIEKPGTTISMTQSASSIYGQPRDTSVTSDGVNLRAIIHESRWQKIGADSNGIPGSSIKLILRHFILTSTMKVTFELF